MIARMSDIDLAKQLKSLNEDIGPVTPNTRPLYERRLMKHLVLEQAASCTIPYTPPGADDTFVSQTLNNEANDKPRTVKESCPANGAVVSLPHGVSSSGDVHGDTAAVSYTHLTLPTIYSV